MHLRIYQLRPDVRAVVHAHPPTATGFAVAGEGLVADVLPEIIFLLGRVPLVPYATPGSSELAEGLAPYVPNHDAYLLANHGATTVGPSLLVAHQRMESLEHAARILFTARQLGRVNPLAQAEVQALLDARRTRSGRAGEGAQTQAVTRERVDPGDVHSGRSDENAGRRRQ
jgi:L-fuculose-phosphate aldolase